MCACLLFHLHSGIEPLAPCRSSFAPLHSYVPRVLLTHSAAKIFTHSLPTEMWDHIYSLKVSLHGSLAATGVGHMTPNAVLLGLMGEDPETVEVGRLGVVVDEVRAVGQIDLGLEGGDHRRVRFDFDKDLVSAPPHCES